MRYRRAKGSGFLYAVYMIFICAVFSGAVRNLCIKYNVNCGTWEIPLTAAGCILIVFLVSLLLKSIFKVKASAQNEHIKWWEWLIVFLLAAGSIALKLYYGISIYEMPEVILQLFFLFAGMISMYPAVRVLFGKAAALFTVTCTALFLQLTKCDFKFVLFSFLLLLTVWLFVKLCDKKAASWFIVVFVGIITGIVSGWNPVFLAVFLLGLSGIIMIEDTTLQKCRWSAAVMFTVASVAGFCAYYLFRMLYLKELLAESLQYMSGWWLSVNSFSSEKILLFLPFTLLYIFGWNREREKAGLVWITPFLLLNCHSYEESIWMLGWIIMAGIGISSMISIKNKVDEIHCEEEKMEEKKPLLPGEPIPNPLAGPKKHVRKEMDYAFIPEEQQMCFDINELEEELDKFDIE